MGVSTDAVLFYGYVWTDDVVETDFMPDTAHMVYGDEYPVLVGEHCSDEYPMPYLYVQETKTVARRGYPKSIQGSGLSDPAQEAAWIQQLTAFREEHDIDIDDAQGPGWFLVSYMG